MKQKEIKRNPVIRTNLEKIVFEKIPHGFVSRNGPPGVEVEV